MGIVALLIGLAFAFWVYKVVSKSGGELPWLWAIGAFFIWPIVVTIAGFKFNDTAMKVVGIIGLVFVAISAGAFVV